MKSLSLLFLLSFFFASPSSLLEDRNLSPKQDQVKVVFTNQMEKADLEQIRQKMMDYSIDLDYLDMRFNKKGKLRSLHFRVDCQDGCKGESSHPFLWPTMKVGFIRDYKGGTPFLVGSLK